MSAIRSAELSGIFDSRGRPTVEARIVLDGGAVGRAGAPSGASTGAHEVSAFPAGGVPEALSTFSRWVGPELLGHEAGDQSGFDTLLAQIDGTSNFGRIGGNTATALSVALALARSKEVGRPLYQVVRRPTVESIQFPAVVGNCLNGGRHAIGGPDIQEFIAYANGRTIDESIRAALAVHERLGLELKRRFPHQALGRGDEGGWVAPLSNVEAIEMLRSACESARDELGIEVDPGLDLAASEFYEKGRYHYQDRSLDPAEQLTFVGSLIDRYGLRYVEDPFDEEAFEEFAELTRSAGSSALIVGDDLYVTREERVRRGLERHASNGVLIKVNQVGTLSATFAAVDYARSQGAALVASHRSGETTDSWLAHIALGTGARGIKTGVLGGERMAKLNELLRVARASGA